MASKLTLEEKEDLLDFIEHDGVKLILKIVEGECESIRAEVLKFDLGPGDERALVRLKCRAEGADKLLRNVRTALERIKRKP